MNRVASTEKSSEIQRTHNRERVDERKPTTDNSRSVLSGCIYCNPVYQFFFNLFQRVSTFFKDLWNRFFPAKKPEPNDHEFQQMESALETPGVAYQNIISNDSEIVLDFYIGSKAGKIVALKIEQNNRKLWNLVQFSGDDFSEGEKKIAANLLQNKIEKSNTKLLKLSTFESSIDAAFFDRVTVITDTSSSVESKSSSVTTASIPKLPVLSLSNIVNGESEISFDFDIGEKTGRIKVVKIDQNNTKHWKLVKFLAHDCSKDEKQLVADHLQGLILNRDTQTLKISNFESGIDVSLFNRLIIKS